MTFIRFAEQTKGKDKKTVISGYSTCEALCSLSEINFELRGKNFKTNIFSFWIGCGGLCALCVLRGSIYHLTNQKKMIILPLEKL